MRATMARNLANRYGSVLLFSPRLGRLGRVATWGTDFVRLRVTVRFRVCFGVRAFCVVCVCAFVSTDRGSGGLCPAGAFPRRGSWLSNSSTSIGHFPKDVIVNAFAVSIQPMVRPD